MLPTEHIPLLNMLQPSEVPAGRQSFAGLPESAMPALRDLCRVPEQRPAAYQIELLQKARTALTHSVSVCAVEDSEGEVADHRFHDRYCRIQRVEGDRAVVFVTSLLQAYQSMLADQVQHGMTLDQPSWWRLRRCFDTLLCYVCGLDWPTDGEPVIDEPNRRPPEENALWRWVIGHHVFLIFIQGLIMAFNEISDACDNDDEALTVSGLALATTLMDGSTTAFRYATDYSASAYEQVVVPTMMPPVAMPGLSGLLSTDHAQLVSIMKRVRVKLADAGPAVIEGAHAFEAAFYETYEVHKLVCSRFRGEERSSLLADSRKQNEESAIERLDRFQRSRTRRPRAHAGGGCPFSQNTDPS